MKITTKKYAEALAHTLEQTTDAKGIMLSFLRLLQRKKQFRLLPKILKAFETEWNRRRNVVAMRIVYPAKFKDSISILKKAIKDHFRGTPMFYEEESNTLIGGFRVRVEDTLIDASILGQLKTLEQRLMN